MAGLARDRDRRIAERRPGQERRSLCFRDHHHAITGQERPATMAMQPDSSAVKPTAPTLDELIARFWKSPRDRTTHVRVGFSEHMGYPLINIRVWQTGSDGIDRPTVKGIALNVRKLPELHAAISKALVKAKELGLISGDEKAEA
jgi:Transcriptional Coactivator p15 (PC4)